MLKRLFVTGALLALGVSGLAAAEAVKPAKTPIIDVAICLDTSNSMDGLIESAKRKLWDIVNDLAKAKPTPKLRVGLYSYGNDGYDAKIGWVRKELDLTDDLDKVSEKLFALRTHGGTEYVGRVCRDAIDQLKWSADGKALKLIFVCGNEPAAQDPEVQLKPLAETACRKGIVVNTIYCGPANHSEAEGWRNFATLGEGRFASIDQDKGTVVIATPFDKELAKLGDEINTTFCFWGKDAKELRLNQQAQDANAANLGAGIAAVRAQSKAGALYRFEEHDLVEKLKTEKNFDVKKVAEKELPEELKKLKPKDREKYLKELLVKRERIQKKVADLAKKRDAYIQAEAKKNPSKADKAFDEAVRGAVREQAQKKGIEIQN